MDRNKFISLVTLIIYSAGSLPTQGMCSECHVAVENMARDLLVCVETGAEETVTHKINELEVVFENAPNALEAGRKFIQTFIDELNLRYGTHLTISEACALVRDNFDRLQLSSEQQKDILMALDLYESKPSVIAQPTFQAISEGPPVAQIEWNIYPLWQWNFFGSDKSKHSKHSKKKSAQVANIHVAATTSPNTEFELPSKMAVGFACALAGSLVCVLPGGQGVGLWMVAAGATLALDGLSEGERPFYRNMDTGEIIPLENPNSVP